MKILDYFQNETGIHLHINESVVQNKIKLFCMKLGLEHNNLLEILKTDLNIKQKFIDNFTTNETFFYREFKQIEELTQKVQLNKNIKILSLPSSSGEEPYSISMALLESGFSDFEIIGVDINSEIIEKAKKGIYKQNKLRNLSYNLIDKYFTKVGNEYVIDDYIKSFVKFKKGNLFESKILRLGQFDFIFCRNLFIYFDKSTKIKAKKILEDLKKDANSKIFFGHADLF